jgi:choline dehydrogenase-like flavoprotein
MEDAEGRVMPQPFGLPSKWPFLWMWLTRADIQRLQKGTVIASRIHFAAGAQRVFTGIHGWEYLNSLADVERLQKAQLSASDFELSAYHVQGSARMGADPATSAVDPTGAVWGVRNLFVADASLLPATPRYNPQLTIMAFATHVAQQILMGRGLDLIEDHHESHLDVVHAHH